MINVNSFSKLQPLKYTMLPVLNQFCLHSLVGEPRPLKVGLINDSYVVPALQEGTSSYFLQKINHHVFTDVEALQQNIAVVTDHIRNKLLAKGIPDVDSRVLRLVPARTGKLYCQDAAGDYWRMYLWIDGCSQETVSAESARLAGEAFGQFQQMLSDLPAESLVESIPNFHNVALRVRQLQEAVSADVAGRVSGQKDLIACLLSRAQEMCLAQRLYQEGKIPKRINHCDTKVNNILFDKDGSVLCIVDLDTVMPGFVVSDFGDFMRTAASTAPEDEPDLEKIQVRLDIFEAYAAGYLKTASFLSTLEKELLPFGCQMMSYMQAVRFLTDYLNGDTYYKIQYPQHNLVRAKAQARLLEEQDKVLEQMKTIISRY